MSKVTKSLEKLADKFASKLNKTAQEVKYPFDPEQDFLALKAKSNLQRAQQALPDNFAGTVMIRVSPDKKFAFVTGNKTADAALMNTFSATIKSILEDVGPVSKLYNWKWFRV